MPTRSESLKLSIPHLLIRDGNRMPPNNGNVGVNRTRPDRWKADIARSVDMYNDWFMRFAPTAYRETQIETTKTVNHARKDRQSYEHRSRRFAQRAERVADAAYVNVSAYSG